jgi:uncharacterized protein (DUF2062 family)
MQFARFLPHEPGGALATKTVGAGLGKYPRTSRQTFPNIMEARTMLVAQVDRAREGFFHRRMARPILQLLRQGVTPEKLALSIALGAALGVFPVLGTTTALCALAALLLRLNLPAIQIANWFIYPAQIALLIPFFRIGEFLFSAPHLPLTAARLQEIFHAHPWSATQLLWTTVWHAAIAWCLIALAFIPLAYLIQLPLLRRMLRKQQTLSRQIGQS